MRLTLPHESEGGGHPLTQGDFNTVLAGLIGTFIAQLYWIPLALQFLILLGTTTYVVFRAVREIMKFTQDLDDRKRGVKRDGQS